MAEQTTYTNNHMYQRRTSPWAWIVPLIIVAAAIAAYAYYQNRENTTTNTQTSQTTSSSETISPSTTDNEAIQNSDDLVSASAGTSADLSNIAVSQVVSDRIFTIKSGSQTIYSVLSPFVNLPANTTLKANQKVAMTGTLVSTKSEMFSTLDLTASEKAALDKQSLVLLVDQLTISGTNATTNPTTQP